MTPRPTTVILTITHTICLTVLLYILTKALLLLCLSTGTSGLPRYHHSAESYPPIAGARDGLGSDLAQELLSRGFSVVLHGCNAHKLPKLQCKFSM